MEDDQLHITPQTKVGELLKAYPELEDILVAVAPAFKKLRNPVLRRTVAKVTNLAQAARVGSVSVTELVRRLRREVGQPEFPGEDREVGENHIPIEPPDWFDEKKVGETLDARPLIDAGEQPMGRVLRDLEALADGQIYELITPFEPAPLIDKAKTEGISAWTTVGPPGEFRTYFVRD